MSADLQVFCGLDNAPSRDKGETLAAILAELGISGFVSLCGGGGCFVVVVVVVVAMDRSMQALVQLPASNLVDLNHDGFVEWILDLLDHHDGTYVVLDLSWYAHMDAMPEVSG